MTSCGEDRFPLLFRKAPTSTATTRYVLCSFHFPDLLIWQKMVFRGLLNVFRSDYYYFTRTETIYAKSLRSSFFSTCVKVGNCVWLTLVRPRASCRHGQVLFTSSPNLFQPFYLIKAFTLVDVLTNHLIANVCFALGTRHCKQNQENNIIQPLFLRFLDGFCFTY